MHPASPNFVRVITASFLFLGLVTTISTSANSTAGSSAKNAPEFELARIPLKGAGAFGSTIDLSTEVFKPAGAGPFPVLIYAHGRSGTQQERSAMREVVPRAYLDFWLANGFAVVAPARPGYGKTGGADREIPGHRWEGNGACSGAPNPERVAAIAGTAIMAAVEWVREQPWADSSRLILSGNSVGGLTVMSLAASDPTGVLGYINFAGGIAGNPDRSPGKSCAPEKVRDAYSAYGKSSRAHSLWLYAENDLFWGADIPKMWHAAFAEGGSPSQLITTPALSTPDGHDLIFEGHSLWAEPIEAFLRQLGFD